MNNTIKKLITVAVSIVLTSVFIIAMRFGVAAIPAVRETDGELSYPDYVDGQIVNCTLTLGEDIAATRISDFSELGTITKVNYVADKFLKPGSISEEIQIVDLTKPFEFAKRGTLVFVMLNLDPTDENFTEQEEALSKYRQGDYWHFTFSLPPVFGASNVYVGAELVSRNGEIEGYNFIDFTTSYDKVSEKFSAKTSRIDGGLDFYTRRQTMANPLRSGKIVTVHYQSSSAGYAGVKSCPLVGTEETVLSATGNSQALLISVAVLSAVMFAISLTLSLLKKTLKYVPESVSTFGIFLMLLSRFIINRSTITPLFWTAISFVSSFVVLGGALMSTVSKYKKLKYPLHSLILAGIILSFIRPYVSFGAERALAIVCAVVKGVSIAVLFAFIGVEVFVGNDGDKLRLACISEIGVAIAASLFAVNVFPASRNPMFWLCALTVLLALVNVFLAVKETEKANAYLTENLHTEVELQTQSIRDMIAERDNLLQFVSHDLKKPLVSSSALVETLIEKDDDAERKKTLGIIKQHTDRVISNFSEIGKYAKFNYIAEPSVVADLYDVCAETCAFHYPDCNANGIVLKNTVNRHYKVFVKKQGLENALSNIILNAVEHADCSTVTLSVKKSKNRVMLYIADDGKGVDASVDIFRPYVSADKPETGGLGLYICKNIVEAMNGELSYTSVSGNTVFCISLSKA